MHCSHLSKINISMSNAFVGVDISLCIVSMGFLWNKKYALSVCLCEFKSYHSIIKGLKP